jgi:hypothetical protein
MKSCWFLLAFASALLQGQDQPGVLLPKPGTDRPQALKEKPFDWSLIQSQPNGFLSTETQPNWVQALRQKRFDWQLTNTQPPTVLNPETQPRVSTCVVPLLVVPVNPNTDPKMLINPPKFKSENAGIVKGLPPCRSSLK